MTTSGDSPRADVELRMPADGAYVSVLRSTAAGLASRLDFDLSSIEDLRVAVGEACALALPQADEGSSLTAEFHLSPSHLTVSVAVTGRTSGPRTTTASRGRCSTPWPRTRPPRWSTAGWRSC